MHSRGSIFFLGVVVGAWDSLGIFCDGQIKDAHYQKAKTKLNI
jgi:hypothetical protein